MDGTLSLVGRCKLGGGGGEEGGGKKGAVMLVPAGDSPIHYTSSALSQRKQIRQTMQPTPDR